MEKKKTDDILQSLWVRVGLVALMLILTVSLHYRGMSQSDMILRGLFRQFCYLPILVAALWFGVRGGFIAAAAIILAVIPHMIFKEMTSSAMAEEGLEYLYYFLFGWVFGYLSDREREAQKKREELVRQVARMEHMSAIGELAAGLAHEIKNPMGSIKGAAQILEPELPSNHKKREFMDILLEEVDRLNRVVENFLNYARPLKLDKKPFALAQALDQVVKQLALGKENSGIEVEVQVSYELTVLGDEESLRQVFLNLGLNAMEAMEDHGRLQIQAGKDHGPELVWIDFQDTGPGVEKEFVRRIFMPFHSSRAGGTGLGLTISERIVTEHGGRIEVHSPPEGGSIFRVILPEEIE